MFDKTAEKCHFPSEFNDSWAKTAFYNTEQYFSPFCKHLWTGRPKSVVITGRSFESDFQGHTEVNYDSFCVGWVFFNFLHRFREGVFLVFNPWSSLRHFGHTYLSGTLFFLILAQVRWTQTVHSSHSIIGRPAKGPPQKHVTEYQDTSSRLKCILKQ